MAGQKIATYVNVENLLSRNPVPEMFEDCEAFNSYCRNLCTAWRSMGSDDRASDHFVQLRDRIAKNNGTVIPTSWGGVDVLRYDHPYVEKHLVIRGGNYLSYEFHTQKSERLWVHDGSGVLLVRKPQQRSIIAVPFCIGSFAEFLPNEEHCIIALEDMIVYESSIDLLGMDKDLHFRFECR